jgi:hypothetical protein
MTHDNEMQAFLLRRRRATEWTHMNTGSDVDFVQ